MESALTVGAPTIRSRTHILVGDPGDSTTGDFNRDASNGSSNGCPFNREIFCGLFGTGSESPTSTGTLTSTPGSATHIVGRVDDDIQLAEACVDTCSSVDEEVSDTDSSASGATTDSSMDMDY